MGCGENNLLRYKQRMTLCTEPLHNKKVFLKSVLFAATFTFNYNMQKITRKAAISIGMEAKIIFIYTCYLQPIFKITATVLFQLANRRKTADSSSRVIFLCIL